MASLSPPFPDQLVDQVTIRAERADARAKSRECRFSRFEDELLTFDASHHGLPGLHAEQATKTHGDHDPTLGPDSDFRGTGSICH